MNSPWKSRAGRAAEAPAPIAAFYAQHARFATRARKRRGGASAAGGKCAKMRAFTGN
jgi:hypothetical protein